MTTIDPPGPGPEPLQGTVARRDPRAITSNGPRKPPAKPIDGALLWALGRKYLGYYVAFRTEEELTRALAWAFHACARRRGELGMGPLIWNATPRLLIKSRTRGAGKSTLLDLLVYLTGSRRGKTPRITPARLAQIIGQAHEAVFVDEGRLVFGAGARHEDLQACLLVGYTPNGSYEVSKTSLSVFGPVAIATKESLITEASKAVDGDESSLGDLLDRCLTITLSAPDFPMPEVGKRARADGELLARALVAWTDTYRDALEQAAEDIADEDLEAARDRARRGERQTETPRALQIGRPLRAIGRVIDQQVINEARRRNAENPDPDYQDPEPECEAEIIACLGTQAEDIMGELEEQANRWGETQFTGEDEADRITYAEHDDGSEPGWGEFATSEPLNAPRGSVPAKAPPAAAAQYIAAYAVISGPGMAPHSYQLPGSWPTAGDARATCEELHQQALAEAGVTGVESLHWKRNPDLENTWSAIVQSDGEQYPQASYAVSPIGEVSS